MKHFSGNNSFPAGNPIANILVIIVGALAIGASIVLGFFAFVIVGCIVLIMASIVGLRVWWFRRQMKGQPGTGQKKGANPPAGVIEGEYRVVADEEKDE